MKVNIFLAGVFIAVSLFLTRETNAYNLNESVSVGFNHGYSAHKKAVHEMKEDAIRQNEEVFPAAITEMHEDEVRQRPLYDEAVKDMRRYY